MRGGYRTEEDETSQVVSMGPRIVLLDPRSIQTRQTVERAAFL